MSGSGGNPLKGVGKRVKSLVGDAIPYDLKGGRPTQFMQNITPDELKKATPKELQAVDPGLKNIMGDDSRRSASDRGFVGDRVAGGSPPVTPAKDETTSMPEVPGMANEEKVRKRKAKGRASTILGDESLGGNAEYLG